MRPACRDGEVHFDWAEPESWQPALEGAVKVYLMAPHELPVEPAFVSSAVEQGVTHLVLLSSMSIEVMGDERLMAAERLVQESGVDWTIVRANWFNQNFDEGFFREAVLASELAMPLGEHRQAFVDADDIAAVAFAALTSGGHAGQCYEVCGPRALSFAEALAIIGQASGREIRFQGAADAYLAAQEGLGRPRDEVIPEIEAFAALQAQDDDEPNDVVRRVTGREPTPFENYAVQAVAAGAWSD